VDFKTERMTKSEGCGLGVVRRHLPFVSDGLFVFSAMVFKSV
jgi:hypothetical protein